MVGSSPLPGHQTWDLPTPKQYLVVATETEACAVSRRAVCILLECRLVYLLILFQTGTRDGIHVFYALPPKNKDALKTLKKITGLKPSKKHPKIPVFEVSIFSKEAKSTAKMLVKSVMTKTNPFRSRQSFWSP